METSEFLSDAFGRIRVVVHGSVDGLPAELLGTQPDPSANSIAWLLWHLTRIQDDHIAGAAGCAQVWDEQGWYERFGLPFGRAETGYGQNAREVGAVQVTDASLLTGYHDAVFERTIDFLGPLSGTDFDRVVDDSWDPPVTLGVRLVSIVADDLQHAGQAAFLRGWLERR